MQPNNRFLGYFEIYLFPERLNMKNIVLGVAIVAWLSFFGMSWLMITSDRYQNSISVFFFSMFLVVAFTATTTWSDENKK